MSGSTPSRGRCDNARFGGYASGVGFSLFGFVVAVAVLAPNSLLLIFRPSDGIPVVKVSPIVTWIERSGQALCMVAPAITQTGRVSWWWLPVFLFTLAGYYALWGRYLVGGRRFFDLYRPLWKVPVPMAITPVLMFFATAAWLSNPWIAVAAAVLAAGHIPASLIIARHSTLAT